MEISAIHGATGFNFQGMEKSGSPARASVSPDTVNLKGVQLLSDEEVETVFNDTVNMIGNDASEAMAVHGALSESRVFALLGLD